MLKLIFGRRIFMLLFFVCVGLVFFHKLFATDFFFFCTDNNIGQITSFKNTLPQSFLCSWSDNVLLGFSGGLAPWQWTDLLQWLLPAKVFSDWIHAIDLIGASFFLGLFLMESGLILPGVILGGLIAFWVGSNFTLVYAGHTGKFGVILMAGLSLWLILRSIIHRRLDYAILAGGAIGLMFLEQPDVALFFGFALGSYGLFLAVRQWQANEAWLKSLGALILMGGVGVLLAASTMLASYASNVKGAASMQTESPQEKWDYVTQWSWPPEECIDFIAPGYTGWRSGEPEGPYWGRMGRSAGWEQTRQGFMNFKLENTYLGIIPILLALFAMFSALARGKYGGKGVGACRSKGINGDENQVIRPNADTPIHPSSITSRRAEILFWGCVAVITLLLAFGKFFPLYALFYKLPFVNSIRNPNKFLQVFQLALGILAAYGLDGMLKEDASLPAEALAKAGRRTTNAGTAKTL